MFTRVEPHLCGENDLLPRPLERVAEERLAFPEAVHVRGVDEVYAPVQGEPYHLVRALLVETAHVHFFSKLHRAERKGAHDQTAVAELSVLHGIASLF